MTPDPRLLFQLGELKIRLHAAEAMLDLAGRMIDDAIGRPDADHLAAASIAVAEAKVLTSEIALAASSKLFELAGTKSTQPPHAFDRHWRNARVPTLHDPVDGNTARSATSISTAPLRRAAGESDIGGDPDAGLERFGEAGRCLKHRRGR